MLGIRGSNTCIVHCVFKKKKKKDRWKLLSNRMAKVGKSLKQLSQPLICGEEIFKRHIIEVSNPLICIYFHKMKAKCKIVGNMKL